MLSVIYTQGISPPRLRAQHNGQAVISNYEVDWGMKISWAQKEQSVRRDQHYRLVPGSLGNGSNQMEQEDEVSALRQF